MKKNCKRHWTAFAMLLVAMCCSLNSFSQGGLGKLKKLGQKDSTSKPGGLLGSISGKL